MSGAALAIVILQYFVPGFFSMLFRIFGLGTKSPKHAVCGLVVYSLLATLLPLMIIPRVGYDNYGLYSFFVMVLSNCAVFIISSDSFLKTCFLHCSQANILFLISTVVGAIRRLFVLSYFCATLMRLTMCAMALYIALKLCAKPLRFMADTIRTGWLGMIAIPSCVITVGAAISIYFSFQSTYSELLIIAFVSILELGFCFYMWGLYHSLRESQQHEREKTQIALLQSEIMSYNDAIEAAKQSRHDLRHHNAVLLEYLQAPSQV